MGLGDIDTCLLTFLPDLNTTTITTKPFVPSYPTSMYEQYCIDSFNPLEPKKLD